jgi:CubicO group peptidase (beta-lactamase class C family)
MTEIDSYELDRVNQNLAVGYAKEFADKGVEFRTNIFLHVISGGPAGGGYSTVEDLLKFSVALQNGKLIKPETLQTMRSPKPEIASPTYGYGMMVNPQRGIFGHGGDFLGVSANLDMFSDLGYTAIVLSNYDGTRQIVGAKLQELVRSAL